MNLDERIRRTNALQAGDVVRYDNDEWIIESRYAIRGFRLVDLRTVNGRTSITEVPLWNVAPR